VWHYYKLDYLLKSIASPCGILVYYTITQTTCARLISCDERGNREFIFKKNERGAMKSTSLIKKGLPSSATVAHFFVAIPSFIKFKHCLLCL
jgi:hypothetical protein